MYDYGRQSQKPAPQHSAHILAIVPPYQMKFTSRVFSASEKKIFVVPTELANLDPDTGWCVIKCGSWISPRDPEPRIGCRKIGKIFDARQHTGETCSKRLQPIAQLNRCARLSLGTLGRVLKLSCSGGVNELRIRHISCTTGTQSHPRQEDALAQYTETSCFRGYCRCSTDAVRGCPRKFLDADTYPGQIEAQVTYQLVLFMTLFTWRLPAPECSRCCWAGSDAAREIQSEQARVRRNTEKVLLFPYVQLS